MGYTLTARGILYPDSAEPVAPLEDVFGTVAGSVDDALDSVYAEIADQIDQVNDPARCHAWRNNAVTLTTGTWTAGISLQETSYDIAPSAQHSGDLSRVYFRVTGLYVVHWQLTLNPMTAGALRGMIRENSAGSDSGGTGIQERRAANNGGSIGVDVGGTFERAFDAGDYIQLFGRQNAGGDVNSVAGAYDTFIQTRLVAA